MADKKPTSRAGKRASSGNPVPAPSPPSAQPVGGFKVQVIYVAPKVPNPTVPPKDALWFATYPIIPRTGDCIYHNGLYFRVERVFLYENTTAGWCADVEVSYYGRQ